MNGSLPLITVRPLRKPEFSYTRGCTFEQWLNANDESLREWYRLTSEAVPEEHPHDFREFANVQFDLQCELDSRLVDGLYEAELRDSDGDDTP